MQALNKVMLYSVKGVELLSKLGSDKNHSGEVPSGKPSSGKATLEDASSSWGRTRKEAALKADLFAGPDKIVSAGNTYGLIKLTIHEAKVKSEQRYCAVVSIGMQVPLCSAGSLSAASPDFSKVDLCFRHTCPGQSPRPHAVQSLKKVHFPAKACK